MFNIGDEVIARTNALGTDYNYEGIIIGCDEAAQMLSNSTNPQVYGGLRQTISTMMQRGTLFLRTTEKSSFDGRPFENVRYFNKECVMHKIITKEYDPSQNGDTEEDI